MDRLLRSRKWETKDHQKGRIGLSLLLPLVIDKFHPAITL